MKTIPEQTPVTICILDDQRLEPARLFFVLRLAKEEKFLTSSVGYSHVKHWSKNIRRAATFPELETVLQFLGRTKYFAKLDLKKHHICK